MEEGGIKKYDSMLLKSQFRSRFTRRPSLIEPNDSTFLIRHQSGVYSSIVDSFYVFGTYPWEYACEPRVMYSYPESDFSAQVYTSFCLPSGTNPSFIDFNDESEYCKTIFNLDSPINQAEYFTLYFPENPEAPYLYCMKYKATPLTMPTFAHDMNLSQLFEHMTQLVMPCCDIVLCIKTKLPFYSLFKKLFTWIMHCEYVARIQIFDKFVQFLHGEVIESFDDDCVGSILCAQEQWPTIHRMRIEDQLACLFSTPAPKASESICIDMEPFPLFKWTRPYTGKNYYQLGRHAMKIVVEYTTPDILILLYTTAILEKSIILYHPDEKVVSMFTLAIHYIVRPLRWVNSSISVLPPNLEELYNAPNPFIIGTIRPIDQITNTQVYFDLENRRAQLGDKLPKFPFAEDLKKELEEYWPKGEFKEKISYIRILSLTSIYMNEILLSATKSIITDYTNPHKCKSIFAPELFLQHFPRSCRSFMQHFISTQMFQFYIEQKCKKQSDTMCCNQ